MRLFFGISLPDALRAAAAETAQLCSGLFPGRYVLPENYHITLAFLGDVPPERLPDAQDILSRHIQSMEPPTLTLGQLSYFGRQQNAILIRRVHSSAPLEPLHEALVRDLLAAGLSADPGPFSPHVTLARHAALPDAPLPACPPLSFTPDQAHLYLSARDDANILRYTPIFSVYFASSL